jgi:hypothetical protein
MNRLFISLFGLLLAGLLCGCDTFRQEVDPANLTIESSKLVVSCFISPQDTELAVSVTESSPILGTVSATAGGRATAIASATVTLGTGSQSVTFQYVPEVVYQPGNYVVEPGYYRADPRRLPIVAGQTYTLTVRARDGRQVRASCTVPTAIPVEQLLLDSARVSDFDRTTWEYYARLRWRDPASQANYFRAKVTSQRTTQTQTREPGKPNRDTVIVVSALWAYDGDVLLTTDVGQDGQQLTSKRATYNSRTSETGALRRSADRIVGDLLHTDVNYYRYHEAVQRSFGADGNPFAEPVLIPTNMEGGLGTFGAYNRTTIIRNL